VVADSNVGFHLTRLLDIRRLPAIFLGLKQWSFCATEV
jgi:hypothetical protein